MIAKEFREFNLTVYQMWNRASKWRWLKGLLIDRGRKCEVACLFEPTAVPLFFKKLTGEKRSIDPLLSDI